MGGAVAEAHRVLVGSAGAAAAWGVTSGSDGPAPRPVGGTCSALGAPAARRGLPSWRVRLWT